MPSGAVTFLFSDVVGSTRLWAQSPQGMSSALRLHDELMRRNITEHGGYIFSAAGDSFAAAFEDANAATSCAAAVQHALGRTEWGSLPPLLVRIGLHRGQAEQRDHNYYGPTLNEAARVMSVAHGGQCLLTEAVRDALTTSAKVRDLGLHALRDIEHAVQISQLGDQEFPPLGAASVTVSNLRAPPTTWIGSAPQLTGISDMLAQARMMTLTGPGGVGKTRTAIEVALASTDRYPGGTWLIEFAPITDPAIVVAATMSALAVPPQPDRSAHEAIVDWLKGRRPLLVFDNCEHVLGPVAELVTVIVESGVGATILATSREPLGVPGEMVLPIDTLDAERSVELFCDRALAADGRIEFTEEDRAAIATICARLDGVPLAIELAAARVRSLSPAEMLARIDDRFRLFKRSRRTGSDRHQTLSAAVAWSYDLLDPQSQRLFASLSVFSGSFDIDGAEEVCAVVLDDPDADLFELVSSLVEKSMVVGQRVGGATRFHLLETLRQYGEERLSEGDLLGLRDRHLDRMVAVVERARETWAGPSEADADAVFAAEWDNERAALDWALACGRVDLAERILIATGPFAFDRLRHEHGDWASRIIEQGGDDAAVRPAVHSWAALWAFAESDYPRAVELSTLSLDLAPSRRHGDAALAWVPYGTTHLSLGDLDEAAYALAESAPAAQATPDPFVRLIVTGFRTLVATAIDPPSAPVITDEFVALAEEIGSPSTLSLASNYQGQLYTGVHGDPARSVEFYREGLRLAREHGLLYQEGVNLIGLAATSTMLDTPDASSLLLESLVSSYNARHWTLIWLTLEFCAAYFQFNATDRHASAVVLGHLETHHPAWHAIAGIRAIGLQGLEDGDDVTDPFAQGKALDRDQVVHFVMEHLGQNLDFYYA